MKPTPQSESQRRLDCARRFLENVERQGLTGWGLDCELFAYLEQHFRDCEELRRWFHDLAGAAWQAATARQMSEWRLGNTIDRLVAQAVERERTERRRVEIEQRFKRARFTIWRDTDGRVKVRGKRSRFTPDLQREAREYRQLVSA